MLTNRTDYEIRRYGAADWRRVRDIRLEMLADTPHAYLETLDDALARSDDEWRERATWAGHPHRLGIVAVHRDSGRWVGLALCTPVDSRDGRPFVFSVYVAPQARGQGVADALLDRAERWAREQGYPALYLFVTENNARAIAFYRRRGYAFTGAREPYLLDPSVADLEMRLDLTGYVDRA